MYYCVYTGKKVGQHGTAWLFFASVNMCHAMLTDTLQKCADTARMAWHHFFSSVNESEPKCAVLVLKYCILPYKRLGVYFFQRATYQAFIWDRHLFDHRRLFFWRLHGTVPTHFVLFARLHPIVSFLEHPLFFCSSSFSFCLHHSQTWFGSTSNSLAAVCLVLFSEKSITLNLKTRVNDRCCSFFAMTEHFFTLQCHE